MAEKILPPAPPRVPPSFQKPEAPARSPLPPFEKGGPGGILLAALLALLAACAAEPAPDAATPEETPRPPVEARSRVDRAIATTGDVITYTVTVDYDPAYKVELPEPGAEIAGFRIIDIGREDPRNERGRVIEERWYKLRADLVGSYVLPPVSVTYKEADKDDAEEQKVETSEIFVEVKSVLPADGEVSDIHGLKPLHHIERPTPWWWFAAGGGAVVLFALLGFIVWRRRHRAAVVPPRPAHEIAFEALDRLRRTDFADVEAMRRFHFEISEVVRAYVENRFHLNATDLTTEEILDRLDELRGLDRESSDTLQRFLAATDWVKFAAYEPTEEEIGHTYESALSFVEATRERPEEAPETAANDEDDAMPEAA